MSLVEMRRNCGDLLFRLARAIGAVENEECRCCDLTPGQALALLALKPGRCVPMRRVAEQLGVSAGTATRVVDNLVREGLAIRGIDPEDRRRVCGRPTAKGEKRIREIEKYYESLWRKILGRVPAAKAAGTLQVLELITAAAEEARRECCGGAARRRKNGCGR